MAPKRGHEYAFSGKYSPLTAEKMEIIPCDKGASEPIRANRSKTLKYFKKTGRGEYSCVLCQNLNGTPEFTVNRNKYKSTTIFWRHLRKFHRQEHDELKEEEKNQPLVAAVIDKPSSKKQHHTGLHPEKTKEEIVHFISLSESPWTIITKNYFIRLLRYFAKEDLDIPTVEAVKEKAKELYLEAKESIMGKLVHVDRLSLTLNAWTLENDISFLGITVHWVDSEWTLCEQVLAIRQLTSPLIGENMCDTILQVVNEFELQAKVCAVTTNNLCNNRTMIATLVAALRRVKPHVNTGRHILCMANVINLVIQSGLRIMSVSKAPLVQMIIDESDVNEVDASSDSKVDQDPCVTALGDAIERLRDIVNLICVSSQHYEHFADLCQGFKLRDMDKVPLDCPTAWTSTYDMLVAAIKKREALDAISVSIYNKVSISPIEWDMLEELTNILQPLEKVTKLACKSKAPTSNEGIALLTALIRHLDSVLRKISSSTLFQQGGTVSTELQTSIYDSCAAMKTKFSKYLASLFNNQAFAIAALVDPSLQLRLIDPAYHTDILARVRLLLDASSGANGRRTTHDNITKWSSDTFLTEAIDALLPGSEQKQNVSHALELESYLDAPASRGTEPLHWWKTTGQHSFPRLAEIAKEFLSVRTTSAPLEKLFSTDSDASTNQRLWHLEENIEMLLTLKCWWGAKDEDLNALNQNKNTMET